MRSSAVARPSISGSRAAFSITVVPVGERRRHHQLLRSRRPTGSRARCARRAAAPPRPRRSLRGCASRAPIFSRPARWRSTGRAPMAQPPGVETRAWPKRASSGPSDEERRAHRLHQVVGRLGAAERCAPRPITSCAVGARRRRRRRGGGAPRASCGCRRAPARCRSTQRSRRQQRREEQRQRRVLRPAHRRPRPPAHARPGSRCCPRPLPPPPRSPPRASMPARSRATTMPA